MAWLKAAAWAGGVAAGAVATRRILVARRPALPYLGSEPEWLVATIYRAPTDISGEHLPEPLARLGDAVEVRIRPAPGDRGTELAVRPRVPDASSRSARRDAWRTARLALRDAKQLCETGEILRPDEPPTTKRTLLNRPLAYAVSHAREEGRP